MARREPMVGDEVLVRGTVVRYIDGVGALVELFSKTDQYQAWVREDDIADVVLTEVPDEPGDGTWLAGTEPGGTNVRVFRRDDAEGHNDPDRRYHRRWWDVHAEQWLDWPGAVKRGADPTRVLTTNEETR
ncbi:hypothetical protein [Phytohabitans houttuyneae]|uniref:Uncharacterized protein n=1 Tax=Phytohabitans houttuyneae TaxID=1076126 RepID=A0A6V8KBQ2_9ACTN|nr:hypothetical protein [Phytohabitans houttuyneae]GFJ79406.1 hypothetical protein Phou_035860 [Phytohabitans houttuyneae]